MARRVRDSNLESRAARARLKESTKPYYRSLAPGVHLGYRKGKRERKWVMRRTNGDGSYSVTNIAASDDVVDADGKWVLDFWQAQERVRKVALAPAAVAPTSYTVKAAIDDYLVELEGRPSANDTRLRLKAYALPALGSKRVAEITADTIKRWHRGLAKTMPRIRSKAGTSSTRMVDLDDDEVRRGRQVSANRILGLLKAALNHAFTEGKVESDLAWRKVKPFPKVNRSRARYLTLAECKRLLTACDPEFRLLVRAGLETGARYSELARLRVEDFNPDSGTIHIGKSKSGEVRHIVLTDDGRAFFADLVAGRLGDEPMMRRRWKPSEQARPMIAACARAKIVPRVGFHQLRHTWASLTVMNGTPLPVVARNLGYADTRMVEKHYGHLAPSYVADTIRKNAPRFGKVDSNIKAALITVYR
jgi:integrase